MLSKDKTIQGKNTQQVSTLDIIGVLSLIFTTSSFVLTLCLESFKIHKLWSAVISLPISTLLYFLVRWRFKGIGNLWKKLSNQVRLIFIAASLAVGCFLIMHFVAKVPPLWVWGISGVIMGIGLLLSYLSLAQRFHHHDQNLEKAINIISFARIASSVFFLDKMKEVLLVYSHRTDRADSEKQCKDYPGYLLPPVPMDEEGCISLINYFARSAGVKVQSKCACELIWENKSFRENDLLQGNLVVLGSAENHVTKALHDKAKGVGIRYEYGTELNHDSDPPSVHDIIDTLDGSIYRSDTINKIDYGLITRMEKNPLQDNHSERRYVVTMGGCHRQGQKAITSWIDNADNLSKIKQWYPDGTFQILLKCTYEGEKVITVDLVDRCPPPRKTDSKWKAKQ